MIDGVTERERAGELDKVVLSRVCELRYGDRVDVDDALDYLRDHYAGTYIFLFEPSPYLAFYGATPELLVRVEGRSVETMALAGSIKRGATLAEDDALAQELLDDPKNRVEHAFVADAIRERLTPLTDALDIADAPEVLRLSNIQHLYTPVRGQLKRKTRRAAAGRNAASDSGDGRCAASAGARHDQRGRTGAARLVRFASRLD